MSNESGKKIILAIDDVSLNLLSTKSLLSKYFDVRVAKSGELALFILGSTKVDLILLDIEMPGMSGFDFMKIIGEIPEVKDTPVIFVTAHATESIISRAVECGAKDYIVKPINRSDLYRKIFKLFGMPMPK